MSFYIEKYYNRNENIDIIIGGESRVHSVYNAILHIKNNYKCDYVFIHDGVRPIVSKEEILVLLDKVIATEAAILAIKMDDTVKQIDITTNENKIIKTLDRSSLYRAATPQAFIFNKYYEAIKKYVDIDKIPSEVTDDAQIYSNYKGDVYIVPCSSKNIKITTADDLHLIF